MTAAGGVDHDELVSMVAQALEASDWDVSGRGEPAARRVGTCRPSRWTKEWSSTARASSSHR
ncbi:hypothetical protein [Nesterenkonia pannonica]|uniref:hypothetical protein n=1 Tax=Nesterenkonia pannonica TaxID=1548602 RepID=UPI002164C093|nr:hypothetical protein [Nesterenkonia pannonica]